MRVVSLRPLLANDPRFGACNLIMKLEALAALL